MENRSVFIATPAFGGQVAIQYVGSLLGTIETLNKAGIKCNVSLVHGGPYIASERNHAVRRFLETDCTHLLFIDADLEFEHDAALRLLNRDKDLIAGVYSFKHDTESYPIRIMVNEDRTPLVAPDGLIECEGLPTGFMLIKREVIEKMVDFYAASTYTEKDTKLCALFDHKLIGGQWWGEDYIFCKKWQMMGGKMYVDPNMNFSHCGGKAYKGNFHKFMLRQPGGSEYDGE